MTKLKDRIRELLSEGKGVTQVAAMLKVSKQYVSQVKKDAGLGPSESLNIAPRGDEPDWVIALRRRGLFHDCPGGGGVIEEKEAYSRQGITFYRECLKCHKTLDARFEEWAHPGMGEDLGYLANPVHTPWTSIGELLKGRKG